jgi:hypothetical protein
LKLAISALVHVPLLKNDTPGGRFSNASNSNSSHRKIKHVFQETPDRTFKKRFAAVSSFKSNEPAQKLNYFDEVNSNQIVQINKDSSIKLLPKHQKTAFFSEVMPEANK